MYFIFKYNYFFTIIFYYVLIYLPYMANETILEKDKRLLTLDEVAEFLHVNPMTVYSWVRDGKIPAFKIGKVWRFRKTEIDEWLKKQKYKK